MIENSSGARTETIGSVPPSLAAGLQELWQARHLAKLLIQRDIRLRYKQTALGAIWAFLQPLLTALLFGVIFGSWISIPSDGIPYFPFVLVGVAAWMFFAGSVHQATYSLLANTSLLTKVYFPRAVLPISSVGLNLADLLVTSVFIALVLYFYGVVPGARALWAVAAVALLVALALGISLASSALSVYYRDFPNLVQLSLHLLMFASPVVYPASIIPAHIAPWLNLNPLVGIIALLRWSIFGAGSFPAEPVAIAVPVTLLVLAAGWVAFSRLERRFADSI